MQYVCCQYLYNNYLLLISSSVCVCWNRWGWQVGVEVWFCIFRKEVLCLRYLLLLLLLSRFNRVRLLCDPINGSPPGSPVPEILQARTLEWVAISFSNAWKWKVKVKSLSRVRLFATPWTAAYQAPLSTGFSRQEYWSWGAIAFSVNICNSLKKSAKVWSDTLAEVSVKIVRKHLDIPENKYPFIWWSIDESQWVINFFKIYPNINYTCPGWDSQSLFVSWQVANKTCFPLLFKGDIVLPQ